MPCPNSSTPASSSSTISSLSASSRRRHCPASAPPPSSSTSRALLRLWQLSLHPEQVGAEPQAARRTPRLPAPAPYISMRGCCLRAKGSRGEIKRLHKPLPQLPTICTSRGERSQPVWTVAALLFGARSISGVPSVTVPGCTRQLRPASHPPSPLLMPLQIAAALLSAGSLLCCHQCSSSAQPLFFFPLLILIAACTQQEPSLTHNPPGRSSRLTSGALLDVELLRQKPRLPQYPVTPQGDLLFNQGLSADCREGNPFGKRWPRSKAGDRSQIWSRKKKR